jgi:hypothetical protein
MKKNFIGIDGTVGAMLESDNKEVGEQKKTKEGEQVDELRLFHFNQPQRHMINMK